jgi:hypothetical protein
MDRELTLLLRRETLDRSRHKNTLWTVSSL